MYLLLSPAKNLNEHDAPPQTGQSMPPLLAKSGQLIDVLQEYTTQQIADLMKVSDKIATLNNARFSNWHIDYQDDANARPAIYLFDGDAYRGLNAYELSRDEINYLNSHLGILSGLYGLLKPLDLILPYRLEMGTKLTVKNSQINAKNLYDFWGKLITDELIKMMQAINSKTLINLASNEYFKAVNQAALTANNIKLINIQFLDKKDGGDYKIISFYAKRARGLMTRFAAVNHIKAPEALKEFDLEQYYFSLDKSDDNNWTFLRDMPY